MSVVPAGGVGPGYGGTVGGVYPGKGDGGAGRILVTKVM